MFTESVSYSAAILAGLLSFFSPCIIPLIPAYFTFITGFSLEELAGHGDTRIRTRVIVATLAYVLGFSCVFILMGASATLLGNVIQKYSAILRVAGGIAIIVFGIHLTGLFRIRFLEFERRVQVGRRPLHFAGVFVVGMAFGAGWSPCIGPLLGSILIIASSQETVAHGMVLLGIYSAGLALPFVLISVFINFIVVVIKRLSRVVRYVNMCAGALLIVMGVALIFNRLTVPLTGGAIP